MEVRTIPVVHKSDLCKLLDTNIAIYLMFWETPDVLLVMSCLGQVSFLRVVLRSNFSYKISMACIFSAMDLDGRDEQSSDGYGKSEVTVMRSQL